MRRGRSWRASRTCTSAARARLWRSTQKSGTTCGEPPPEPSASGLRLFRLVTTFLIRRLLQAAVVIVLVSMLVYALAWLVPGGPQQAILVANGSRGLGSPAVLEYLHWLGQVIRGNLGYSTIENASVGSLLAASL